MPTTATFESVCYHPLLLFNQHGDCLAAKLRAGNVSSAEDWDELLLPEIERQHGEGKRVTFRADAAFAKPEVYEALEDRGVDYVIRIPANKKLEWEIADILFRPPGRPSAKPLVRYKSFRYQAESWSKRGGSSPRSSITSRAVDQGRQAGDSLDAAVVPSLSSKRSAASAQRALLQPGQPVAATGTAAADQELVADEPAAAADENGRAAGQACPLLLAVAG